MSWRSAPACSAPGPTRGGGETAAEMLAGCKRPGCWTSAPVPAVWGWASSASARLRRSPAWKRALRAYPLLRTECATLPGAEMTRRGRRETKAPTRWSRGDLFTYWKPCRRGSWTSSFRTRLLTAAEMEQLQPEVAQEPAMALEAGGRAGFYRACGTLPKRRCAPAGRWRWRSAGSAGSRNCPAGRNGWADIAAEKTLAATTAV